MMSITVFIIILMPFVDSSKHKTIHNIYRLPRVNETSFDDYQQATEMNKDPYTYEKILNEEKFFHIIYNLEARRIPKQNDDNFESYTENYQNYCKKEYKSFEAYTREKQLDKFKKTLNTLSVCLNGDQGKTLKNEIYSCLNKNSTGCHNFLKSSKTSKTKYLIKHLTEEQKITLLTCMEKISLRIVTNVLVNTTYNYDIINLLNGDDSKTPVKEIPDKKLATLEERDLNLLKEVVRNDPDDIVHETIFLNYTKLEPVNDSVASKEKCFFYEMTERMYKVTKIIYKILPMSTDENFEQFKYKLANAVEDLNNITETQEIISLKIYLQSLNKKRFDKMKISRRAIDGEDQYLLYAMRLLIKGYMPLTLKLWSEERNNLSRYQLDIDSEDQIGF